MADIMETIEGLRKAEEHFESVQNAQRENGKYVSANFKLFENACSDAIELLKQMLLLKKKKTCCKVCDCYNSCNGL